MTDSPANATDSPPLVIDARGLCRDFHATGPEGTAVHALVGVDLAVRAGEFVALVGTSGSGKSTLLGILGCLDRPTAGAYVLDGRPVEHMDDAELARVRNQRIGIVFQAFNLLPRLRADENVALPLRYAGWPRARRLPRARQMLDQVGLGDRVGHRPDQLSGGQAQRVAIARALVTDPALLLADEPTGNLDSASGEGILQLMDELHTRGATIVMVTHDPKVAARADRRVHLQDGRVVRED